MITLPPSNINTAFLARPHSDTPTDRSAALAEAMATTFSAEGIGVHTKVFTTTVGTAISIILETTDEHWRGEAELIIANHGYGLTGVCLPLDWERMEVIDHLHDELAESTAPYDVYEAVEKVLTTWTDHAAEPVRTYIAELIRLTCAGAPDWQASTLAVLAQHSAFVHDQALMAEAIGIIEAAAAAGYDDQALLSALSEVSMYFFYTCTSNGWIDLLGRMIGLAERLPLGPEQLRSLTLHLGLRLLEASPELPTELAQRIKAITAQVD